jgi:MFS family permease
MKYAGATMLPRGSGRSGNGLLGSAPMDAPETAGTFSSPPSRRGAALALLRKNPDFRLLFAASIISFAGDWFLFVALAGLVFSLTHSSALVAALYAALTVPFALFTFVGGPLADRLNRQFLMVAADVMRGVLALGFLFIHRPSQVWIVFVLIGAISALGAVFEPASGAAIPNLVDREDLITANVLAGAVWGTMLAVGSAIGGLVVVAFGRDAGYIGDAASFLVSAILVLQIRGRFSERRGRHQEHPGLIKATAETVRYARKNVQVLALLSAKAGFGLAGGVVALLPLLSFNVFQAGDRGTGVLLGFRGLGVLIGPFLVRRLVVRDDDLSTVFWGIGGAYLLFGLAYGAASWMPLLVLAGACVFVAHLGGGAQWTLSTYALQVVTPDHIRGRVFAFDYGLVHFTLAVSATVSGRVADVIDVRVVMLGLAAIQVAYSVIWTLATLRVRRSLRPARQTRGGA